MNEINPVFVAGSTLRRRGAFEASSLWSKKDVIPPYETSSVQESGHNIQVNPDMSSLNNLRDSTGPVSNMAMDSILGYWPWPGSELPKRYNREYIPDGYHDTYFTRIAFKYYIVESDEYHKPWDGVSIKLICYANWVTITKVTTYVPGSDPVVVETTVSTPNNIEFTRSFVAGDWVYDPMAPSQIYEKYGSAYYDNATSSWVVTNGDLVGGEFKYKEVTYTIVYDDPYTGGYVETEIVSGLEPYGVTPFYSTEPFVMESCVNPGFWGV